MELFPSLFERVFICLPVQGHPNREMEYPVRVTEVTKQSFTTEIPFDKNGYPIRLESGFPAKFIFYQKNNLYQFETQLIAYKSENIGLYVWNRPKDTDIVRIQRRGYFRVPVLIDGQVWQKEVVKNIGVVNLSGGGLAFRDKEKAFELNQQIKGSLSIPLKSGEQRDIPFIASVRRILSENDFYLFGLEFVKIGDADRDHVIQYCLTRQREIRQHTM